MIITVTMNPAIDKTVEIGEFQYGGLNRIQKVVLDPGGKGINVSKTIRHLGGNTIATGFLGGNGGEMMKSQLNNLGIKADFLSVEGETRTNMKVIDASGNVTELNEPGPVISQKAMDAFFMQLQDLANEDVLFILAGSVPAGIDKGIYGKLIEIVKKKGAKVFLDADGELFVKALDAKPDFIKPNQFELEQYFEFEGTATEEDLVEFGKKLQQKGIKNVAISLGKEGALFVLPNEVIRVPGLKVKAHSTVGAGDAMVAALCYGMDSKRSMEECIKLAVATSAGAVTTVGTKPPSKEVVEALMDQVELIKR